MLQKRMLFFSPPPIGVVCYRGKAMFYVMDVIVLRLIFTLWFISQLRSLRQAFM